MITDASGRIVVNDLRPGSYQFVETKAPTGYELDATPRTFTIENNQTEAVQISVANKLTPGGVVLTKVDGNTGESLQGAVFELQDEQGRIIDSGLTTDASGKIAVNNLKPGDYQFVETKAPTGYELDNTPRVFTIEKGQSKAVELTMANQLITGGVVLAKVDETTGESLQGAVFELQDSDGNTIQSGLVTDETGKVSYDGLEPGDYQFVETKAPTGYQLDNTPVNFTIEKGQKVTKQLSMTNKLIPGSVVLTKTDATTGESLQGAVFELQDDNGNTIQSGLTTDETGKISFDGLEPGNYQFVETTAPTGYELDATPVTFTIEKGQKEAKQLTVTNRLTPGSVVLTKTDATTGEVLQGAIFTLQDKNGKAIEKNLTTDASGKVSVNDLAPGNYQFVETQAPIGYQLDSTPIEFEITKNQQAAVEVKATNELMPGSVILTKTDAASGEALQGAIFELQSIDGKVMKENLSTDYSGKIAIDGLEPGDYQFVETQAPTGYELDATPVKFSIEKNQQTAIQVTKTNKLISGGVILEKIDDETGKKIAGAEFELQTSDGKVLMSNLKTDSSGRLAVEGLAPGNYQLVETQAPAGYQLDQTPVTFEVVKGQKDIQKVTKNNKQLVHALRIQKKDGNTKQFLAGAEFKLLDANGKVVKDNLKTDKYGVLEVKDLATGNYQLVETKAPKGYLLDDAPILVVLSENDKLVTVDVYNYQATSDNQSPSTNNNNGGPSENGNQDGVTPENDNKNDATYFPKTGEKASIWLSILGILLLASSLLVVYRRRSHS